MVDAAFVLLGVSEGVVSSLPSEGEKLVASTSVFVAAVLESLLVNLLKLTEASVGSKETAREQNFIGGVKMPWLNIA